MLREGDELDALALAVVVLGHEAVVDPVVPVPVVLHVVLVPLPGDVMGDALVRELGVPAGLEEGGDVDDVHAVLIEGEGDVGHGVKHVAEVEAAVVAAFARHGVVMGLRRGAGWSWVEDVLLLQCLGSLLPPRLFLLLDGAGAVIHGSTKVVEDGVEGLLGVAVCAYAGGGEERISMRASLPLLVKNLTKE